MTLRKANWINAACMAVISSLGSLAGAQDGSVGVVRISDAKSRTQVQPAAFHHGAAYGDAYGGYGNCPNCPNGGCPNGNCQTGLGPTCFHGMFQEHYCKNSPDHGYSPPAKYPLHRRGVQYNSYFPNQWYGTPGASYASAPVVYQPTDTTQMGYYYQQVPFWQPNPAMMPQRPVPPNWHITAPAVSASNFHGAGWGGYAPYYQGAPGCNYALHRGVPSYVRFPPFPTEQCQEAQPVNNGPIQSAPAPVQATPMPEAGIPPMPNQFQDSAESGHIRRALY